MGDGTSGTLNITGGTVRVGSKKLTLDKGTLNIGTGETVGILEADVVDGVSSGAIVNFNHTGNITFTQILSGELSVNKLGSGTTTLTGNCSYDGTTEIDGGTLVVTNNLSGLGDFTIGNDGAGTLTVPGGSVTSYSVCIGRNSTGNGTVSISSGAFNIYDGGGGELNVGYAGTGTLNITGSIVGYSGEAYIGNISTGSGTLTINSGLLIGNPLNYSSIYVGKSGSGTLNIAGGNAANYAGYIGYDSTGNGTVSISSGSWANNADLYVGYGGSGTLKITGGNVTNTGQAFIGFDSTGNGTVSISSGSWVNSDVLYVGYNGSGTLSITGGNVTNAAQAYIYKGTAAVGGGIWASSGSLTVGDGASGTLSITGGNVTNTEAYISGGTAAVTGGTWASSGSLTVGDGGSGTLSITGGNVTNTEAYISGGTAAVTGGIWASSGNLTVGDWASGTLNISGGSVTNTEAYIWGGTAMVSGGLWASSGNLTVQSGTLSITGGTVGVGSGTLTLDAGTLNIGTGTTVGILDADSVTGNGIVNFNHSGNITFTQILSGELSVNKLGAGTTALTGNNSYDGTTAVTAGTLLIAGDQSAATGALTVDSGATLAGTGTIGGSGANIYGILAPGDSSIGTLNVVEDLTWIGSSTLDAATDWKFDLGAAGTSDHLAITGTFGKGYGEYFRFDFGGSSEAGTFTLVSWTAGTSFSKDEFSYTNLNAGMTGTFDIGDNMLSFNAVAIPEPDTCVLVLGACVVLYVSRRPRRPENGGQIGILWERSERGVSSRARC